MSLGEILASSEAIPKAGSKKKPVVVDSDLEEEVASDLEMASNPASPESPQITTRSGRLVKKRRYS